MKHLIILTLSFLTIYPAFALNAQPPTPPTSPTIPLVSSPAAKANSSSDNSASVTSNISFGSMEDKNVPPLIYAMGTIGQLGFFVMIGTIVWLGFSARERQRRITHETIRLMIEKGQPVPPELFLDPKVARPRNDLRRGVVYIAAGIGISIFFISIHPNIWPIGLIPMCMGVGYIIVWKTERSQRNNGNPS